MKFPVVVLLLLIFPMVFAAVDRQEDIFILSKDTNSLLKQYGGQLNSTIQQVNNIQDEASYINSRINNIGSDIGGMLWANVLFTAFLTAFFVNHFIVKKMAKKIDRLEYDLKKIQEKKEEVRVIKENTEIKKEPEFTFVERRVCPKGCEGNETDAFCPTHGKKYAVKKVKVFKEITPNVPAIENGASALEAKVRKPLWKKLLRL